MSAFGVEHTVAKSYVPGQGYKAAKDLGHFDKLKIRNNRKPLKQNNSAKGREVHPGMNQALGTDMLAGRVKQLQFSTSGKTNQMARKRGIGVSRYTQKDDFGGNSGGQVKGFALPNNRGGGRLVLARDADKHILRHELQHLKPKRNPHTLNVRGEDPIRRGREEGRADYLAHGKATPGSYPGDDQFKQGYNEVQYKMARAKREKKR